MFQIKSDNIVCFILPGEKSSKLNQVVGLASNNHIVVFIVQLVQCPSYYALRLGQDVNFSFCSVSTPGRLHEVVNA